MGFLIVLMLLLFIGGGAALFFFVNKSDSNTAEQTPMFSSSVPTPGHAASDAWSNLDSLHHSDDYIPQETIYSYHNPNPGVNCLCCDAENPSGMSYCQVCGAKLSSIKY